jgi:hypothetical protein
MPSSKASLGLLLLSAIGLWQTVRPDLPSTGTGRRPDRLATELRRFRAETDPEKLAEAIKRFGKVRDPRVTVALMEVVQREKKMSKLLLLASGTLVHHHIPEEDWRYTKYWDLARLWWEENEAGVRRRAALLPQ